MPADILIYALVAAGLIFWLRSVLGTRNGSERQRPNPFTPPLAQKDGKPVPAGVSPVPGMPEDASEALALPAGGKVSVAGPSVETGLLNISRADRTFHLGQFVNGAQDAFVMIVEAFAAGDRALLKSLLTPDLYAAFDQAIAGREADGHSVMTEIHAIRKVEILEALLKDQDVFVTLRFVADETSVERDRADAVISGNPDRVRETIDVWTFGRNIRSKDPTWFLYATRDENPGAMPMPPTPSD